MDFTSILPINSSNYEIVPLARQDRALPTPKIPLESRVEAASLRSIAQEPDLMESATPLKECGLGSLANASVAFIQIFTFVIEALRNLGLWLCRCCSTQTLAKQPVIPPNVISQLMEPQAENRDSNPFQEAQTSAEYQRALTSFKNEGTIGSATGTTDVTPTLKEKFDSIKEKLEIDPDCDIVMDLFEAQELVLETVLRDLKRTSIPSSDRKLVINGKEYGYDASSLLGINDKTMKARKIEEQCIPQILEIYNMLSEFYQNTKPELALPENYVALQEHILIAMDQLHQGAIAPLLLTLMDQFQTANFFLSTGNSYSLELRIDPETNASDGSKGSLLLQRKLTIEAISYNAMENRSLAPTPTIINEHRLPLYEGERLKGEGFVTASCQAELKEAEPLNITYSVL
ncbi:MAG: hypothetical protein NTX49_03815 [Chlamydiae bacterium]|nr:hypothetical protein [Chlamydiota bacterium]